MLLPRLRRTCHWYASVAQVAGVKRTPMSPPLKLAGPQARAHWAGTSAASNSTHNGRPTGGTVSRSSRRRQRCASLLLPPPRRRRAPESGAAVWFYLAGPWGCRASVRSCRSQTHHRLRPESRIQKDDVTKTSVTCQELRVAIDTDIPRMPTIGPLLLPYYHAIGSCYRHVYGSTPIEKVI